MAKPPKTEAEAELEIARRLRETPQLERQLYMEMMRLQDSSGQSVYTAEQIDNEINRLKSLSFTQGYAQDPATIAYEASSVAEPAQSVNPNKSDTQKLLDAFYKQVSIPVDKRQGTIRGAFEQTVNPRTFTTLYLESLINKGVEPNQAATYTVGLESVYDYFINEGNSREDSLRKALETSKKLQDPKILTKLPKIDESKGQGKIDFSDPSTWIQKQFTTGNLPDLSPEEMAYFDGIREQQLQQYRQQFDEALKDNRKQLHTLVKVNGYTQNVPTDVLMFLQENLPYTSKDSYITQNESLEDAIRNNTIEIINEGEEYETNLTNITRQMLSEVQARDYVGKNKDNWFLDPESKKHVLENAEDFYSDFDLLFHDTITGGTVETPLMQAIRTLISPFTVPYGIYAPVANYGMEIIGNYVATPISKALGGLEQDITKEFDVDFVDDDKFAQRLYQGSDPSLEAILSIPEDIDRLEEKRQQFLKETMPNYANVNDTVVGRIAESVARGGGIMLGALDVAEVNEYDPATTGITALAGLYFDFKNPIDHAVFDSIRGGFTAVRAAKLNKAFDSVNLGTAKSSNIVDLAVQDAIRYQLADDRHIGKLAYKFVPKSYKAKIGSIDDVQDIRNLQAVKVRHNLEAYEEFLDVTSAARNTANRNIDTVSQVLSKLDESPDLQNTSVYRIISQNADKTPKQIKDLLERGFINADSVPSLNNYKELRNVFKTIENRPNLSVEQIASQLKSNSQFFKNPKLVKAIDTLEDITTNRYGTNVKLDAKKLKAIQDIYRHRASMMAMADLMPGVGKLPKILAVSKQTFVNPKQRDKIMDVLSKQKDTQVFMKAMALNNSEVARVLGTQIDADYFRGAYIFDKDKNKMIYKTVTQDSDQTVVPLIGLAKEEKQILRNAIITTPLRTPVKARMLDDLNNRNYITVDNWNNLTEKKIDNIAEQLQMGMKEADINRLSSKQLASLNEAFGHVSRGSLLEAIGQAKDRVKNAQGLKNKLKVLRRKENIVDSSLPNSFFALKEQQILRALPNEINTAVDRIPEVVSEVLRRPLEYNYKGSLDPKNKTAGIDALQTFVVGLVQASDAGKLAQSNRLADMLYYFVNNFVFSQELKPNRKLVDQFFSPNKVSIVDDFLTNEGQTALRNIVELQVPKIIKDPTKLTEILLDTSNTWFQTLSNPKKMKELQYISEYTTVKSIKFFMDDIAEQLDEVVLNLYQYKTVQEAQIKMINEIAIPNLPEMVLSKLRGNLKIDRFQFNDLIKNYMSYKLGPARPSYAEEVEYMTKLLNGFVRDVKLQSPELNTTFKRFRSTLKSNIAQNANKYFTEQTTILNKRIDARKKAFIKQIDSALQDAKDKKFSITKVKGPTKKQRANAVKTFNERAKIIKSKRSEGLERLKTQAIDSVDKLKKEQKDLQKLLDTGQDGDLVNLFRSLEQQNVISIRNKKLDEVLKIMKTEDAKFSNFDPAVHEILKYSEQVAKNNDLYRSELSMKQIDKMLKDIFSPSNRFGQAFFGKKAFKEFEATFRTRGTKGIQDAIAILAKQKDVKSGEFLLKTATKYASYIKQVIYTLLLRLRPRFIGTNATTAQAIIFQNIGTFVSPQALKLGTEIAFSSGRQFVRPPKAIIEGFQTAVGGSTTGQSKFYQIAVTDKAGRSYTHGQLYQMVHAAGIRTDLSITNDVNLIERTLKKLRQPANQFMGLNIKNLVSRGIDTVADLPITTDMAFRIGVAIDSIQAGNSVDEAVKMAKISLFDYNKLLKFEQTLANFTIFYNFQRQNLTTTLMGLTNPQRFVELTKFIRGTKDIGNMQRISNDGRVFPYNATMPNYTNTRSLLSHVKEYADRDVYLFAPPMPLLEATAMISQFFGIFTMGGTSDETISEYAQRLLHPAIRQLFLANVPDKFNRDDSVSPELVTFSRELSEAQKKALFEHDFVSLPLSLFCSAVTGSNQSTEQWLSFFHGRQVVGEYNPDSMYSVDGYTYRADTTMKRNAMSSMLFLVLDTVGAQTTMKDYMRMFYGDGTSYEPLNTFERLAASLGLVTPIGIKKPAYQDLRVLENHKKLIQQKTRQIKGKRKSERENR